MGEDQEQHLEYARRLLRRYNVVCEEGYTIPTTRVVVGRVRDLRDPNKKMSKSSPSGCLFLDDPESIVRKKIRKARTSPEGLENLSYLYREFVEGEVPVSNLEMKERLAERIIEEMR